AVRRLRGGGGVLARGEGEAFRRDVARERVGPACVTVRVLSATPVGDGVASVHAEYVFPDATWTQTFRSRPMTPEEFEEALGEEGLRVDRYLTEDRMWVRAVRAGESGRD